MKRLMKFHFNILHFLQYPVLKWGENKKNQLQRKECHEVFGFSSLLRHPSLITESMAVWLSGNMIAQSIYIDGFDESIFSDILPLSLISYSFSLLSYLLFHIFLTVFNGESKGNRKLLYFTGVTRHHQQTFVFSFISCCDYVEGRTEWIEKNSKKEWRY